jgi:RNA polymerase sigma-70 factor (ECF subfamily)
MACTVLLMAIQTVDTARTDDELLAGVAAGEEAALAELYDRYHLLAFSLALRVLRDRARAEDVVQDAFLAVWRKAPSFAAARGSVKTWLAAIVRNRAIDVVRARRESDADDEAVLLALRDTSPAVEEQVTASLDRQTVRAAMDRLPAEQRRVVELAYFEGLSHSEIAEMTALPLGTVKGRIRLAMQRLRAELLSRGFEHPAAAAAWSGMSSIVGAMTPAPLSAVQH